MGIGTAKFGTTGYEISRVGLGAWAIGGGEWQGGWGPQDDAESIAAIHHGVELGINWIDTAAAYGLGRAEEVVGRAVAELPQADRPLIFTKCGLVWEPGARTVSNVLAPESIRRECEDSLRRLGVDAIDLYQIHWPSEDGTPLEDSWATMAELVEEGKVRAIGTSNFDIALLDACESIRHVDTYQPELNLVNRHAAGTTIPWAGEHDTGVIVYSPMRSGLLTGRFTAERVAALPEDDWRRTGPDFQQPDLGRTLELVDVLAEIAHDLGCSVPELAVAWTLAWPGVSGAIVGARNPDQVDGWIGAAGMQLAPDALDRIAAAIERSGAGNGPALPYM
ncbi:MAG TPA: aldo/keto reductase [Acidimicrobiales bacterium]|nr:aldo/keto reductase [Acidimicrobiales bacterium]